MKEYIVDIKTADGFCLKAIVCMPDSARKIVIMCHGITSHKQEYLDMFPMLAAKLSNVNIGSIRFDYRGHGESSGRSLDFSVVTQVIDLSTVLQWIKSHESYEKLPISYVGVSFGSAPGLFYQKIHHTFREISLFAPVVSFKDTFVEPTTPWGKDNFNHKAWQNAIQSGSLLLDGEFNMGLRLLNELLLIEPLEVIGKLNVPIQVFHGSGDTLVPYSVAEQIQKVHSHIDVRLIPGMGHGLYFGDDEDGVSEKSKIIQENYYRVTTEFLS